MRVAKGVTEIGAPLVECGDSAAWEAIPGVTVGFPSAVDTVGFSLGMFISITIVSGPSTMVYSGSRPGRIVFKFTGAGYQHSTASGSTHWLHTFKCPGSS